MNDRREVSQEEIEYYLNLNWTLVEGTDLDFNGNPYHYIEIKEFPSLAYCAKTREIALANYKNQLKIIIRIMLEEGEKIYEPGEKPEDDTDWEKRCPGGPA